MDNNPTDHHANRIIKRWGLVEEEAGEMRSAVEKGKVHQTRIRTVLLNQGQRTKHALYLLEGTLSLTIALVNGQKTVVGQVVGGEVLALGAVLSKKGSEHSITVASDRASYIWLPDRESHLLATLSREQIKQTAAYHQQQLKQRNQQVKKTLKSKQLEDNIQKLALPEISQPKKKAQSTRKLSLAVMTQQIVQEHPQLQNSPMGPLSKGGRSMSLSHFAHTRRKPPKKADKEEDGDFYNFSPTDTKLMDWKLNAATESTEVKRTHEIDYKRNEKIFKQQLKNIVKRKLVFERKHFKVLTGYKNEEKASPEGNPKLHPQDDPIDNYFDY